ncbi:MAG: tetratricopeptide repeat protein [Fidelibacterota bacterium]
MKRNFSIIFLLISFIFANDDFNEALSLFEDGNYSQAQIIIESAISIEPENAQNYFLASKIAFKLDNLDEAWTNLLKAIDLDLNNDEYRDESTRLTNIKNALTDAKKSYDNGYYEESISAYERINSQYPDFAMPYYLKGMVYYVQKEYDLAAESIKEAIKYNPFEEKYSAAINNVVAIIYNEGNDYFSRNDYDGAIKMYEKALSIDPNFSIAHFRLAYLHYKIGDYETCISHLESNIKIDPKAYKAYKLMGDTYSKMGDTENAIKNYMNSIEANRNYDKAYFALGLLYQNNGENDKAITTLTSCVEVNPKYGKAHETLGSVYQSIDKFDEAISCYNSALDSGEKTKSVYYRLASAYNLQKNYSEAKSAAKQSLELDQNYPAAHFELGLAEKCLGNKAAARAALEEAAKSKSWRKPAEFELKYIDQDCE